MQKRNTRGKSIITQIVFHVSVVFIVTILIFVCAFLLFIGRYMKDNIISNKEKQVEDLTLSLNDELDSLTTPILSLASYDSTVWLIKNRDELYSPKWLANIRNVDAYLQNVSLFNNNVLDILIMNGEGDTVYCMSDNLDVNYEYLPQEWFVDCLKQKNLIKYVYHNNPEFVVRTQTKHVVSCIFPVKNRNDIIGYVMMEYDLSDFTERFLTTDTGDHLMMLDQDGKLILDNGKEGESDTGENLFFKDLFTGGKAQNSFFYEKNLYFSHQVPDSGWTVVSETDTSLLLQPVTRFLVWIVIITILTIMALIVIAVIHTRKMRKPVDELVERISNFDGKTIPEKYSAEHSPLELNVIGTKFDEMAEHISCLIQDVYLAQIAKKEMELETMVNQINPHFLYNVFQLIQTEAVITDNRAIEEMIQALSNMMRYTMERKVERVTIAEEIAYIEDYLMFYKERFPSLFTCENQVSEEVKGCETIKFILQPVVENCFKHGFKDRKSGGEIRIHVYRQEEYIIFTVWDNGKGISPEKLSELCEQMEGHSDETGIGIVNTNARLKLVYGPDCGIFFDSREHVYTEVTIKIKIV